LTLSAASSRSGLHFLDLVFDFLLISVIAIAVFLSDL
jgi:hypothetical protein